MLEIAILMAIGKIQDSGGPAWFWALLFTGIDVMAFGYHGPMALAITAGYAWGYFLLLRRVGDSLLTWLLVLIVGGVLPLGLTYALLR
ncbi:MAG: hypothetical protein D8H94_19115 [Cardiobacterium sp.]|jgi:hypothetical protein|nr:MAG: hypothetical protein D8H94_19115 [Cardiobacterium sp.]